LSFDTDYINEILLPIVERNDVVVNDEWAGYLGRFFKFATRMKRAVNDQPGHGHAQHPLVDRLLYREVVIRSQKGKYIPSFAARKSLRSANFSFKTDSAKKLEEIFKRRFPPIG
jgi:hypothetical protein